MKASTGKYLALLFAMFLISVSVPAFAGEMSDDAKYQADLEEGISLLKSGSRDDLSRSIAKFKSALKIRPESAEAYYWISLAYSDQNNYLRAADNAKDATIYDERFASAWLLWGQVLLYQKNWDEALAKLETAARLEPDNPVTQFNLGRVHYHGFNNPDTALSKFRSVWQQSQALRRDDPAAADLLVQARLYMGYCEFDRGRWDNAINAFRDVLAEQGNHYEAALRLAMSYRNLGRVPEAERILQSMLRVIPPDNPANLRMIGEVNLQLADLYLKDPNLRNKMFALAHLRGFLDLASEGHSMYEPAQQYLAANEFTD